MYAVIQTGGKQYRVKPGDTLSVRAEVVLSEPGENPRKKSSMSWGWK